jgi:hypothetical protein
LAPKWTATRGCPVVALGIEHFSVVAVERSACAQRRDPLSFEIARDCARCTEARVGLGPLIGEAAAGYGVRRLLWRQLDQLGLEPPCPHEQRELVASRPRDQLLDLSQERVNGVARGTLSARVWRQGRKSSVRLFE